MVILEHSWILWLLPLPLLYRAVMPAYRARSVALRAPWFSRLTHLSGRAATRQAAIGRRSRARGAILAICWLLTLVALARPQWIGAPITKSIPTRDLMLSVDLSGSMETEDFTNQAGEKISRLEAVKGVLGDFLLRRKGDRVGLIVFGSAAFVQSPFSEDLQATRTLLEETAVRMAGPKTALGDSIGLAIRMFKESKLEQRVIIVLTDGNDTGSRVPPAKAAAIAADEGIRIHTIAVGDPTAVGEAKIDEATLREMARLTGGRFFRADDREQLAEIYVELDRLEARQVETLTHRPRRELYPWPLGLAFSLLLLTLAFDLVRQRARLGAPSEELATC